VQADGRPARTHYEVQRRFEEPATTLLECRLETGRTHQIRVHLASLGHPLVGDPAYGRKGPIPFSRQALHAARLALVHPVTGRDVAWQSPLPQDFQEILSQLRRRNAP
jgi:23S rRNA pseudouridine1911/1915/1917 synthase